MLHIKFTIKHTDLQFHQAVLQLHLALDLLHRGPVRLSVQVPKRRPTVHWVLLLGPV